MRVTVVYPGGWPKRIIFCCESMSKQLTKAQFKHNDEFGMTFWVSDIGEHGIITVGGKYLSFCPFCGTPIQKFVEPPDGVEK